jgi:DNA repair exonuclease SbcCD ATPase subunit
MYRPISITAKNLFSYKQINYDFLLGKTVFIYGINESDEGADSNGAGKSTLMEAITLAITGDTYRGVDKEEFINNEENDCYVILELQNVHLNKYLKIRRDFFRGSKSSKVSIYEDKSNAEEHNKEVTSVNEANKRIFNLLGITKDDFLNYFVIGQGNSHSFFSASDGDKKVIISRFTNLEILDSLLNHISAEKKRIQIEYSEISNQIAKLEGKLQEVIENYEDEEKNWKERIKNEIRDLLLEKKEIKEELEKEQSEKIKYEDLLKKQIKKMEGSEAVIFKVNDLKTKLSETEKKERQKIGSINTIKSNISELKRALQHKITCENCGHEFLLEGELEENLSVEEIGIRIQQNQEVLEAANEELKLLKSNLSSIQVEISNLKNSLESASLEKAKLTTYQVQIENAGKNCTKIETRLTNLDSKINSKKLALKEENQRLLELREKLESGMVNLETKRAEMDKLNSDLENYSFWDYHFGKKGFSTYLANQAIKNIEGVTNSFLKKFHTNLSVSISGFTKLKSGELREKIDVFILKNGRYSGKYGKFSGGEKGRINLAGILGLQKLINLSTNGRGLDLLGLDEMFEGLDSTGQIEISRILDKTGVTTLVISHMNKPLGTDNELFALKRNDISVLTYER